ncbi:hypothetical protein [Caenimonas soli]|uniref:hypothetical protein n=1 Tax=Caenimonas soli TaxID=2735555 RepID=UPI001556FA6F|nr:hypothetical protein [Caenimonas soli]NPC55226.1 hypothetical protein [Caenimonas soli]
MPNTHQILLASLLGLMLAAPAHAGRPLTVDDASVNEAGAGHVEAWYARLPGRAHTWTVAPAYAPIDGLELGAAISRDRTANATSGAVQAKWRITPSQESGCNVGAVLGVAHTRGAGGNTPYVNGLATCNSGWGASHFNLGAVHAPGESTLGTWGIAHEREFGRVTAHVEAFGQRHSKPTFQVGARMEVAKGLQIDGTVGRSDRENLVSVGLKQSF